MKLRLAADPDLLRRVRGLAPGSVEFSDVLTLGQDCTQAVVFAPQFSAGIQSVAGGQLSSEQVRCLEDRYKQLSRDDHDAITNSFLHPNATGRDEAMARYNRLLTECGVKLPK